MYLAIFFLGLFATKTIALAQSRSCNDTSLFRHCAPTASNRWLLVCSKFDSFAQLDLECTPSPKTTFMMLSLAPTRPQVFALNARHSSSRVLYGGGVSVLLYRITGIDLFRSDFLSDLGEKSLRIMDSVFEIYANGSRVDPTRPLSIPDGSRGLFSSSFNEITFRSSVIFKSALHPMAFQNADIFTLKVSGLTDSFLLVNLLRFAKHRPSLALNSSINTMDVTAYDVRLGSWLFHRDVHVRLASLFITGDLIRIEPDAFEHLRALRCVSVRVASLKRFFRAASRLEWLRTLDELNITKSTYFHDAYTNELHSRIFVYFSEMENAAASNDPRSMVNEAEMTRQSQVFYDEDFCIYSQLNISRTIAIQVSNHFITNYN